jgi:hypothetical protein
MKKWFIALVCAFTFLLAQNALAAIVFKRFPHCGDGLVTVKTCECHASNSRILDLCGTVIDDNGSVKPPRS